MEPTIRIEVLHRVADAASGLGDRAARDPAAKESAASQSPLVDLHSVRLDLLETLVNDLSDLMEQTIERLDGHWQAIKQLESKVIELDRSVGQHDTLLRALVVTPKTRARAQRAGLGPS